MPDLPDAFLRADDPARWDEDREDGMSAFLRLDDEARIALIIDLLMRSENRDPLNRAATAGAFRSAWDSEPYLNGVRLGSYISAVALSAAERFLDTVDELVGEWVEDMMTSKERRRLLDLPFPLTVYRGGVGDPRWISEGMCWTTDIAVADFYARKWPARWGIEGVPHILSAQVDRSDVSALFDDRQESEVVICGGLCLKHVTEVPIRFDDNPCQCNEP